MENYGGDLLANFAWGTDRRWSPRWDASHHAVADLGAGWVDDFHIWELAWDEESMTILLDGDVLNSVSLAETVNGTAACEGDNPFRQPHYLLLNLALGGAGGSVDDLAFPTRYLVDYVRIYQE
jgi:beta-glucanase (GH16 family)